MEDAELLLTVAEIAVAFAGFSGLVTILGQRLSRVHPQLVEHNLRAMILTSLLAVSFSLFPFLPYKLGVSPGIAWRISAGVFGLVSAVYFFNTGTRRRALGRSGVADVLSAGTLLNATLWLLAILVLLAVAAGIAGAGYYFIALFIVLYVSGQLFFTVFVSLLKGRE
jgi:hypothetical protein